ncbi:hypothetical protein QQS21_006325 [Conoideocrella luteorostrata]|uniref:Fido domain-containing protein n=1 Tax=Conoideocrella luteorostrata TaxID=1105319 RepID=A0AAJ0G095_9HYPO|nr:hypothetical protein QQS21_006325 [Conoideocrella luteorostrata]
MQDLSANIGKEFISGWPTWRSIRSGPSAPQVHFQITLADRLRDEANKLHLPADPAAIITQARRESQRGDATTFADVWNELETALITLVYGSNMIESAGTNLRITTKLCQNIFRGIPVTVSTDERDPAYQEHLETLIKTNRKGDKSSVILSRKEVVTHAKALNFAIDHIVLGNMAWSEDFILQTHKILYDGIDEDVVAGKYRDHEVGVCYSKPGEKKKSRMCMRASAVPRYMKEMIEHLNEDIVNAETSGEIDPYTLAARYHHQFVMIHPFGDGNGRMSRIILNVLLLKYAGHVTLFGSEGDEKDDYLAVVGRGGKIFASEDMEVDFHEQTSHFEFAKFILTKSKANLEQMWTWAVRKRDKKTTD